MRTRILAVTLVAVAVVAGPGISATASTGGYHVVVTCQVPKSQKERQLAPNSCLNYVPDGTQTYTALVLDSSGTPVPGVRVRWTNSDAGDAHFRQAQNPCHTGPDGDCAAELKDPHPQPGEQIVVTATAAGASAQGYLTFS